MYEINLAWTEAGEEKTRTISDREPTKHPEALPGTVRIGREPTCDIVLEHPTVSRLHAEIFYDGQRGGFYLRNLKPNNRPMVNEQIIEYNDKAALNPGSTIYLGQTEIKVMSASGVPPTILRPPEPSSQKTILWPHQPPTHQNVPIAPPQIGATPPESSQTLNPQQPQPGENVGYWLVCSNPDCSNPDTRRLVSYEHLNVGCPWCGAHLADGKSVFIPRGSN